jgi:predicted ATPase
MYRTLRIRQFRAIEDLTLDRLSRVNILVGSNSTGKTSVLEAVWLLRGAGNPDLPVLLAAKRGTSPVVSHSTETHWEGLFPLLDRQSLPRIEGETYDGLSEQLTLNVRLGESTVISTNGDQSKVGMQLQPSSSTLTTESLRTVFQMRFHIGDAEEFVAEYEVSSDGQRSTPRGEATRSAVYLGARSFSNVQDLADRFTKVEDIGELDAVVQAMQQVEPKLEELSLGFTTMGNLPMIRMRLIEFERRLPVELVGGGARRLLEILLSVNSEPDAPIMIDEIENGFYFGNLASMWRAVNEASKITRNQIFATTHSFECIEAAIAAFRSSGDTDLRLFRLERRNGGIAVVDYDFDVTATATDSDLEVR